MEYTGVNVHPSRYRQEVFDMEKNVANKSWSPSNGQKLLFIQFVSVSYKKHGVFVGKLLRASDKQTPRNPSGQTDIPKNI